MSIQERVGKAFFEAIASSGGSPDPGVPGRLTSFVELVQEFNAKMDLTAAREVDELVDLMIADAAVLAGLLPRGASVVDVGAGAGAPGLALALAREDLVVTLVEPLDKRVMFLRTVIGRVARTKVLVERARGEQLVGRKTFDAAISRATLPPADWLALGRKLVSTGGEIFTLLAQAETPSCHGLTLRDESAYRWPLTGADRRIARFTAV